MKPKKILIFSLAYYPHVGGAEVAIKEITDRISPEEYEFHLVCNRYDSTLPRFEQLGNINVHRIGYATPGATVSDTFQAKFYIAKIFFIPLAVWKAWRLHRQHEFHGFWSMMLYMSFPVALLRLVGVRLPYAVTLQEGDTFEHVFNRWYIRLVSPLLLSGIKNATVVQTISTFLKGWAVAKGYRGTVQVIPNAVDTAHFTRSFSHAELSAARTDLGKQPNDVFLVTTSRLVPKNGIDTVISAMPLMPENVHFVVFGTGPDEAMLKALAVSLQVSDRVHFHGHLEHKFMPKYLKACDIFIRPSRSEGMGNSFIEAMAAGVPVIATQVGGIKDFLFDMARDPDHAPTGWVVDVDAPGQIARAVEDILNQPEQTRATIVRARQMVVEKYDWTLIAQEMKAKVFDVVTETVPTTLPAD